MMYFKSERFLNGHEKEYRAIANMYKYVNG